MVVKMQSGVLKIKQEKGTYPIQHRIKFNKTFNVVPVVHANCSVTLGTRTFKTELESYTITLLNINEKGFIASILPNYQYCIDKENIEKEIVEIIDIHIHWMAKIPMQNGDMEKIETYEVTQNYLNTNTGCSGTGRIMATLSLGAMQMSRNINLLVTPSIKNVKADQAQHYAIVTRKDAKNIMVDIKCMDDTKWKYDITLNLHYFSTIDADRSLSKGGIEILKHETDYGPSSGLMKKINFSSSFPTKQIPYLYVTLKTQPHNIFDDVSANDYTITITDVSNGYFQIIVTNFNADTCEYQTIDENIEVVYHAGITLNHDFIDSSTIQYNDILEPLREEIRLEKLKSDKKQPDFNNPWSSPDTNYITQETQANNIQSNTQQDQNMKQESMKTQPITIQAMHHQNDEEKINYQANEEPFKRPEEFELNQKNIDYFSDTSHTPQSVMLSTIDEFFSPTPNETESQEPEKPTQEIFNQAEYSLNDAMEIVSQNSSNEQNWIQPLVPPPLPEGFGKKEALEPKYPPPLPSSSTTTALPPPPKLSRRPPSYYQKRQPSKQYQPPPQPHSSQYRYPQQHTQPQYQYPQQIHQTQHQPTQHQSYPHSQHHYGQYHPNQYQQPPKANQGMSHLYQTMSIPSSQRTPSTTAETNQKLMSQLHQISVESDRYETLMKELISSRFVFTIPEVVSILTLFPSNYQGRYYLLREMVKQRHIYFNGPGSVLHLVTGESLWPEADHKLQVLDLIYRSGGTRGPDMDCATLFPLIQLFQSNEYLKIELLRKLDYAIRDGAQNGRMITNLFTTKSTVKEAKRILGVS